MTRPADELENLRRWRTRQDRDVAVGDLIAAMAGRVRRTQTRLGTFIEVWERLVPPVLVAHTRLTAIRRGVAHVAADSASAAFELDRLLRGGLEAEIRRQYPATLTRIRVAVGAPA